MGAASLVTVANIFSCFVVFAISQTWCSTPDTPNATGLATDGSGWSVSVTNYTNVVVYDNQGNVVSGPGQTDANGNEVSWDQNGNLVDELGRTLVVKTTNGNIVYYDVLNSQGTRSRYTVTKTTINANTAFGKPYATEYNGTITVVQSLTLPNLTSYAFTYDSGTTTGNYGVLKTMTLPTGGQIQYGYATFADSQCSYTRWLTSINSAGNTWSYAPTVLTQGQHCPPFPNTDGLQQVALTKPNGASAVYTFDIPANYGAWNTTTVYRDSLGNTVENQLKEYISSDNGTNGISSQLPSRLTTSIPLGGSSLSKKIEYSYDTVWNGNVSEVREWDYYTGTAPPTVTRITDATYTAANSAYFAAHILGKPTTILVKSSSGTVVAQTQFEYDNYTAGLTPSGAVHHNSTFNTSYTIRGNVTAVQKWRNTDGAWLTTRYQYDDAGKVRQTSDPLGHTTLFSYADSWGNAACAPAPASGSAGAYRTAITNALTQTTGNKYNSCAGTLASTTDVNGQITNFAYDFMNRRIQTLSPPDANNQRPEIDITYNESSLPVSVTTTTKITSSMNRNSNSVLDGLGRLSQTQLASDPQGTDFVDTTYDSQGRVATVSNPYRTPNDPGPTNGITTTQYDALNRVVKNIPPDGTASANNESTTFSGNCSTTTDQAGKIRKRCFDGLGRLIQVFEPDPGGNLVNETDYQYDLLDNLLRVDQKGNDSNSANWRTRTFVYNSLSQLSSATNPETGPAAGSGTITYTYDSDGNVLTKTDGRGVTITYTYDPLHRRTKKSFSDSTATVTYAYDGTAPTACSPTLSNSFHIGRRTAMCDAGGWEAWNYDSLGRVLTDRRNTSSVTKDAIYTYNLDGSTATITYPSGRTIAYTYNAASLTTAVKDLASGINYATGALYAPQGELSSLQNGAGFYTTALFNKRLQPCWIFVDTVASGSPTTCTQTGVGTAGVLDFQYDFGLGSADNGNVNHVTNRRSPGRSITYQYDELNRIHDAVTDATSGQFCWGQLFGTQSGSTFTSGYDPWGNLKTITPDPNRPGCTVNVLALTINAFNKDVDSGFSYDNVGNLTAQPGQTYTYDAEGHLKTAAGITYTYDGDGKRVQKSNGKLYWYGMGGGDPLDETDSAGNTNNSSFNEYVFLRGKRVARRDFSNNVFYYFGDHLGTSRVIVQAGQASPCYDADYYPFGGEAVIATNTCPQNYKFTGKERDTESGLDEFGARYYSSSFGRFTSADWSSIPEPIPYANYEDPQSLNLYSYVQNRPVMRSDADGHCGAPCILIAVAIIGGYAIYKGAQFVYHEQQMEAHKEAAEAQYELLLADPTKPGSKDINYDNVIQGALKDDVSALQDAQAAASDLNAAVSAAGSAASAAIPSSGLPTANPGMAGAEKAMGAGLKVGTKGVKELIKTTQQTPDQQAQQEQSQQDQQQSQQPQQPKPSLWQKVKNLFTTPPPPPPPPTPPAPPICAQQACSSG